MEPVSIFYHANNRVVCYGCHFHQSLTLAIFITWPSSSSPPASALSPNHHNSVFNFNFFIAMSFHLLWVLSRTLHQEIRDNTPQVSESNQHSTNLSKCNYVPQKSSFTSINHQSMKLFSFLLQPRVMQLVF